jgi:hypothetical protein
MPSLSCPLSSAYYLSLTRRCFALFPRLLAIAAKPIFTIFNSSVIVFFLGFFFSKGEHLSRLVDFIGCYLLFPCPQSFLPELLQKRDPIPVDLHSDLRASSGAVVAAALTWSKVLECYSQS